MVARQQRIISSAAFKAIDALMGINRIQQRDVSISVSRDATYQDAMLYAWRYVGNGVWLPKYTSGPMYRINKYIRALHNANTNARNIVLVDIGSGPGTFIWALMDWIIDYDMPRNDIHILAYDYSTAMMKVAYKIIEHISNNQLLPDVVMESSDDVDYDYVIELTTTRDTVAQLLVELYDGLEDIIRAVRNQQMQQVHYLVTLGYVLAANHSDNVIDEFTRVISTVTEAAYGQHCTLVVCDTDNTTVGRERLNPGWQALMANLARNGVRTQNYMVLNDGIKLIDVEIVR